MATEQRTVTATRGDFRRTIAGLDQDVAALGTEGSSR